MNILVPIALVGCFAACIAVAQTSNGRGEEAWTPEVPRVWDEEALSDWALPLAALGEPPMHMSSDEYYALPEENLKSYPVYMPGREPEGYWDGILRAGPEPLIRPETLVSKADWVAAGERVFFDWVVLRTLDPEVVAMARDLDAMQARGAGPLPDGTINGLRWVPTDAGVALGMTNCSACHLLYLPDNTAVPADAVDLAAKPDVRKRSEIPSGADRTLPVCGVRVADRVHQISARREAVLEKLVELFAAGFRENQGRDIDPLILRGIIAAHERIALHVFNTHPGDEAELKRAKTAILHIASTALGHIDDEAAGE